MPRRAALIAAVALLPVAAACSDGSPLEPETEGSLGVLLLAADDEPRVEVPETVESGEPFTVTITTFGLDSCWDRATTEVDRGERSARVTPRDVDRRPAGGGCRPVVREIRHTATLSFERPGLVRISVRGRALGGGVVILDRSVFVR